MSGGPNNLRHGHNRVGGVTTTYRVWLNMIQRCTNADNPAYPNYGGRGIKVCTRWRKFENFLADMGERPAGLTLDRRNNDGSYCKRNCRWATRLEQAHNMRRRKDAIMFDGKLIVEWMIVWGVAYGTAQKRIYRLRKQHHA